MRVLFRVDASRLIGMGHLTRCLTLAKEAYRKGWTVCFVLRDPSKDVIRFFQSKSIIIKILNSNISYIDKSAQTSLHGNWLSVSQETDAMETLEVIYKFNPNWVVVDHYALDAIWHRFVRSYCKKIMVIDDLGDRQLDCDIILDQNLGASPKKYLGKIKGDCAFLLGPNFALLRAEFKDWRERSIRNRINRPIEQILVTMGGVDFDNYTYKSLKQLSKSKYAKECSFTVITGAAYPHLNKLSEYVSFSDLQITILSDVNDMASIMSKSDLCIGAAGSTSWERCCLGLPTIVLSIAENQNEIAKHLSDKKLAIFSNLDRLQSDFDQFFDLCGQDLRQSLSLNSSFVCDALGSSRVLQQLEATYEN